MNYFCKLPLNADLIRQAIFETKKREAWEMWVAAYPNMTKTDFTPFEKFFTATVDDLKPKTQKTRATMLRESQAIQDKIKNGQFRKVSM